MSEIVGSGRTHYRLFRYILNFKEEKLMETQNNTENLKIEENDYVEEEVIEPVEITETMWYQHPTDHKNFEFLNVGQLTPLKRYDNTIISVNHLNEKYRMRGSLYLRALRARTRSGRRVPAGRRVGRAQRHHSL